MIRLERGTYVLGYVHTRWDKVYFVRCAVCKSVWDVRVYSGRIVPATLREGGWRTVKGLWWCPEHKHLEDDIARRYFTPWHLERAEEEQDPVEYLRRQIDENMRGWSKTVNGIDEIVCAEDDYVNIWINRATWDGPPDIRMTYRAIAKRAWRLYKEGKS